MRKLAFEDLDACMAEILCDTLKYRSRVGGPLDPPHSLPMNSTGSTRRNRQIRFDGLPVKTNKEQIERKHAMTSQEYCKIAVAALEDRKAEDVKIIDIREISPVADYFVIADGTNQNQIQGNA